MITYSYNSRTERESRSQYQTVANRSTVHFHGGSTTSLEDNTTTAMPPHHSGSTTKDAAQGRRWQGLKTLMRFEPWPPVVHFLSLFSTVLIIFLQIIQGSTSDHHCGTTTTETDTTTGSNSSSSRDSEMRTSPW